MRWYSVLEARTTKKGEEMELEWPQVDNDGGETKQVAAR